MPRERYRDYMSRKYREMRESQLQRIKDETNPLLLRIRTLHTVEERLKLLEDRIEELEKIRDKIR
jgi:hypothetical protein